MTRAVQSVLDQDYAGAIEVIVVFDGAEPFMPAVQSPRVDRSVCVTPNSRARGLAGARNSGIAKASYDLIAFLDDDDVWLPTKLAQQTALLAEHPTAGLVGSGITMVAPEGDVDRPLRQTSISFDDLLEDRIAELHSSTLVWRKEFLSGDLGGIDEALPGSFAEDYDLLLRASKIHAILGISDPLVRVAFSGGSQFSTNWEVIAEAMTYLLAKHPEFQRTRAGYARIAGQVAFAHAAAGNKKEGARWAVSSARRNPAEPRAALAMMVIGRLARVDDVLRFLRRRGRGI